MDRSRLVEGSKRETPLQAENQFVAPYPTVIRTVKIASRPR
jgi:hypothetical protein